jgi:hypothetical protein
MTTDTIQILELFKQGANSNQIAEALGREPAAIEVVIRSHVDNKRKLSLEERFGDLKAIAIDTLKEIAQTGMNESARVNASKILLDEFDGNNGHGGCVKIDYQQIAERIAQVEGHIRPVENLIKLTPRDNNVTATYKTHTNMMELAVQRSDVEFEEVAN